MLFIRSAFVEKFPENVKNNSSVGFSQDGLKQFLPNTFQKTFHS